MSDQFSSVSSDCDEYTSCTRVLCILHAAGAALNPIPSHLTSPSSLVAAFFASVSTLVIRASWSASRVAEAGRLAALCPFSRPSHTLLSWQSTLSGWHAPFHHGPVSSTRLPGWSRAVSTSWRLTTDVVERRGAASPAGWRRPDEHPSGFASGSPLWSPVG